MNGLKKRTHLGRRIRLAASLISWATVQGTFFKRYGGKSENGRARQVRVLGCQIPKYYLGATAVVRTDYSKIAPAKVKVPL